MCECRVVLEESTKFSLSQLFRGSVKKREAGEAPKCCYFWGEVEKNLLRLTLYTVQPSRLVQQILSEGRLTHKTFLPSL